jgi:hypothetical protein
VIFVLFLYANCCLEGTFAMGPRQLIALAYLLSIDSPSIIATNFQRYVAASIRSSSSCELNLN